MPGVKDDRAPPASAKHERRAQARGSAANDNNVKEFTIHQPARGFTISP
jgi:hypothetical protein